MSHVALLDEAGGDFRVMDARRLAELNVGRLNVDRRASLSPNNPETERLRDLAGGMEIPLPTGFKPNGASSATRPRLRKLYVEIQLAVDSMFYEMVEERLAIPLPMLRAEHVSGAHFSSCHWAPKQGEESGRPIIDPSNGDEGSCVLNGKEVKRSAIERRGPVTLPTIETIMAKFITFKNEFKRPRSGIELWKMDLKGAFTLLSFKASNCQLIATELEGGVALFFLCGIFGWTATPITATPIAFAVVSRAILHEMEERTGAACDMFVDDALAASLIEEATSDRATTCGDHRESHR